MLIKEYNEYIKSTDLSRTQSRIIECESWDTYVSYFTKYNGNAVGDYTSVDNKLTGFVLPKMVKIYDLNYNDHMLTCLIHTYSDHIIKRVATIVTTQPVEI